MKLLCNTRTCVFLVFLGTSIISIFFFLQNRNNSSNEDTSKEFVTKAIKISVENYTQASNTSKEVVTKEIEIPAKKNTSECIIKEEFLGAINGNSSVDWEKGFKNCGNPMEGCDIEDSNPDYKRSPKYCRCDHKCVKYGDCCVTVLRKIKTVSQQPIWRCIKLPNSEHGVRMISKCPLATNENNVDKRRCENLKCYGDKTLCPWLDIPVLHKETRDLYRNIFCARCHGILNSQLYKVNWRKNCTKPGKVDKWGKFERRAIYLGNLKWVDSQDNELVCERKIEEFLPDSIQKFVPEVRFCPLDVNETCDICLGNEENIIVHHLCHSYLQVVTVPVTRLDGGMFTRVFKNAHCAKCNHPDSATNITRTGQCHRLASRHRSHEVKVELQSDTTTSTTGSPASK